MSRKKKHPEHVNHERWLVSYADFITLLFAFFTTLYAISTVDQKKAGKLMFSMMEALHVDFFPNPNAVAGYANFSPISPMETMAKMMHARGEEQGGGLGNSIQNLRALTEELKKLAKEPELRDKISLHAEGRGVVVSLTEAGFFESGSAELRPGAFSALAAVAMRLKKYDTLEFVIEGHTDNIPVHSGKFGSNWELSTARSTYVVRTFAERLGLDPARLSPSGYAEYKPVATNDTPEGRAKNRRVDIVVRPLTRYIQEWENSQAGKIPTKGTAAGYKAPFAPGSPPGPLAPADDSHGLDPLPQAAPLKSNREPRPAILGPPPKSAPWPAGAVPAAVPPLPTSPAPSASPSAGAPPAGALPIFAAEPPARRHHRHHP